MGPPDVRMHLYVSSSDSFLPSKYQSEAIGWCSGLPPWLWFPSSLYEFYEFSWRLFDTFEGGKGHEVSLRIFYGKKYRRCVSPTTLRCSLLGATFQLFMLGGGLSAFSNTFSTGPTCHSTCESASCPLNLSFFTLVTLWSQPLPAECLSNQQPDHWWLARRPPPCWSLLLGVCWQKMQIWSFGGWKNTPNYIL